jgi:hypothetical protein
MLLANYLETNPVKQLKQNICLTGKSNPCDIVVVDEVGG